VIAVTWITLWISGAYTAFLIWLTLIIAIPYFGLWLIDMPTGGFVVRMMRCENRPDAWYSRPSHADANGFSHFLPVCLRPCALRSRPQYAESCCGALPQYMPDWCPQQQVYRTFRAGTTPKDGGSGPFSLARYTPMSGFSSLHAEKKHKLILEAFKDKVEWYQRCYVSMHGLDYLNRHLCDNFDLIQGLDSDGRKSLIVACSECFCDYEPSDLDKGIHAWATQVGFQPTTNNKAQCDRLHEAAKAADADEAPPDGAAMLSRALRVALLALCVLLVLFALIEGGSAGIESSLDQTASLGALGAPMGMAGMVTGMKGMASRIASTMSRSNPSPQPDAAAPQPAPQPAPHSNGK
jgi:hypothetical protein